MRSGLEERRERGSFGLSTAIGPLDNQRPKGVGFLSSGRVSAKVCPAMPPLRSELTRLFRLGLNYRSPRSFLPDVDNLGLTHP